MKRNMVGDKVKIGIIKEGKNPPDERVPLSPEQCAQVQSQFPNVDLVVQPSAVRRFKDAQYENAGVRLQEDLSDRDILIGVKEVPLDMLIAQKTYLFFSHTFKLQPYNAILLKTILEKKIRLVDYEVIKDTRGKRLIGFGRYAGIVGCYNGLRAYGLKHGTFALKRATDCEDRKEMEGELSKVKLPADFKMFLTGFGRVGHGAREILALLDIAEISKSEFEAKNVVGPSFYHADTQDYYARLDGKAFDKRAFYSDPSGHKSLVAHYCEHADMYVACHYWSDKAPKLITQADMQSSKWRTSTIADISCDIADPIASTLRPSTIADPIYGYDPASGSETDFKNDSAICVMAVDNLPCELPKDASADFGAELIKHVLPALIGEDPDRIIERASETNLNGELMPDFAYLQDYVAQA